MDYDAYVRRLGEAPDAEARGEIMNEMRLESFYVNNGREWDEPDAHVGTMPELHRVELMVTDREWDLLLGAIEGRVEHCERYMKRARAYSCESIRSEQTVARHGALRGLYCGLRDKLTENVW